MRNPLRRYLRIPVLSPIIHPPPDTLYCHTCRTDRVFDTLPGHQPSGVPDWSFCVFCGAISSADEEEDLPDELESA